ncbi:MAG: four helix bundle protein [Phycisphaerales bacterium]
MPFLFEHLKVYQRAVGFADRVLALAERAPRPFELITSQAVRAAISIAANLAEGSGRSTAADQRRFFVMARGSVHECVPLLELAHRRGLLGNGEHEAMKSEVEEIARMLAGLIRRVEG